MDVHSLRDSFDQGEQGHVFNYWEDLSAFQRQKLITELSSIDVNKCNRIFKKATTISPTDSVELEVLPEAVFDSLVDASPEKIAHWNNLGLELISQNKVGVILLAGGQGTRLGSSAPKGCYDILLPSHKSLFQLQAERIHRVQTLASAIGNNTVTIPWYVMTSGPTRKPTQDFFIANNYFGLSVDQVIFFEQGVLPAFSKDGKFIMEDRDKISVAPDGNGGIYAALKASGIIDDLDKRGIPFVHAYCVDNCLVKVADPVFLGYCVEKGVECGAKSVVKRNASEPVGVICVKNGKYSVVEYSEMDEKLATKENDKGQLMFRAANIANHFYTTQFLKDINNFEAGMDYHVAKKKIKSIDLQGNVVVQNGIKLELFIFDVFPFAKKFAVLESIRSEEFSPLKNAPGCEDGDSPDTSRADILALHVKFATAAGAIVNTTELEISPLVSYAGEGLEHLAGTIINEPTQLK